MQKYNLNGLLLDRYQTRAILCNKKNILVVAGAGSGKTLTIVAKIKYLIDNNVDPKKILCISFTNETVNSLKNKLNSYQIDVDVKTFHRFSLDIIGKHKIVNDSLLEYIVEEFFNSFIYYDKTYLLLKYIDNLNNLKKIIISFINQMKSEKYDFFFLYSLLHNKLVPCDDKLILVLIFKVYVLYYEELNSEYKIDFNDIINFAVDKVDTLKYFKYKYIIIDEYQDTSYSKYLLIKKLQDKFDINIMAVGDDYQSIYSFTGCNLNLFIKFKKLFKESKIIKLKYIYRNSSDLVEISKRFVLKNRNQIVKHLVAKKYFNNSIVIIYSNDELKALTHIVSNYDSILALGRNNKDIDKYKDINFNKDIRFLTIHASKGLEEDNVVILNAIDDYLGIPNKISKPDILKYINGNNLLEEERRLFYVALTRAKNRVFIITKKNKESIYVKELIKSFKRKIKIVYLD